jgi:hypothetical protein
MRHFDLESGVPKLRWNLPGDNSTCNHFAIGPDKALYITDTTNSYSWSIARSMASMASPSSTAPSM